MEVVYFPQVKKKLGIRNRFWRKRIELLKPKLNSLYILSLKRNYFPIWIAFRKTSHKKKMYSLRSEQLEEEFYKNLVKYLNDCKNKKILIDDTQKAKIVKIQKNLFIVIQNPDGSEDFEKRKKLQDISKKILDSLIKQNLSKEEIERIFLKIIQSNTNFYTQPKDTYLDLLESPIGKIFSKLVPGLDIILEIQKYKEIYKEKDFFQLLQFITQKNIKVIIGKLTYSLLKKFPNYSKFFAYPLAIASDYIVERYERYQFCEDQLEKNFQKLLWIKKS